MNCVTEFTPWVGWRIENHHIPLNSDRCINCGLPKTDIQYFLGQLSPVLTIERQSDTREQP